MWRAFVHVRCPHMERRGSDLEAKCHHKSIIESMVTELCPMPLAAMYCAMALRFVVPVMP